MRSRRPLLVLAVACACSGDPTPSAAPVAGAQQSLAEAAPQPRHAAPSTAPKLQRHTVRADGHELAVHSKRPQQPRAALLLVHGRTWSGLPDFDLQVAGEEVSLMDSLAAAGVATYAVDLRGYGETPRDETGFTTPNRSAADVAEVLRFIATDAGVAGKPFVLGWSRGALVAALTVQTRPELAAGLVLYGYPCAAGEPTPAAADPQAPQRAANTAEAAASDFITPGSVSQAVIDGFVAAALKADPVRADWRHTGEWDQIGFDRLRVPVLVLHGEHDPITDRGCMAGRFAQLQEVDRGWTILAGSDHAAHLERSAGRFVAAVVGFVAPTVR